MKFLAASIPRSVRAARLAHLRMDAVIGMRSFPNTGGGYQVFDIIMQAEADFMRTKNHLASPAMGATLQQGGMNAPYVLKDTKEMTLPDGEANAAELAAAYFRKEFNLEA